MKKIALILRILSPIFIIAGISMIIVSAVVIKVPSMTDPSWFELKTAQSGLIGGGAASFVIGIILLVVSIILKNNSFEFKQAGENLKQTFENFVDSVNENFAEFTNQKPKKKKCEYCGTEFDEDKTNCPNCGAKN